MYDTTGVTFVCAVNHTCHGLENMVVNKNQMRVFFLLCDVWYNFFLNVHSVIICKQWYDNNTRDSPSHRILDHKLYHGFIIYN